MENNNNQNKIQDFKDIKAWQEGHKLAIFIYKETKVFPKEETYSLVDQMRRAAVSVTSNIAEGFGRHSYKEKANFYRLAHGSLTELENQLLLSKDIGYLSEGKFAVLQSHIVTTQKILGGLITKTKSFFSSSPPYGLKSLFLSAISFSNLSSLFSSLSAFLFSVLSFSSLQSLISVLFLILVSSLCSLISMPLSAEAATIGKPSNYLLQSGLVGWWTFDQVDMSPNVRDKSGQGNHGYIVGQTSTSSIEGKIGQALNFDGVDDYTQLPGTSSNLNLVTPTISLWVKMTRAPGAYTRIFDKAYASSYYLGTDTTGTLFKGIFKNGVAPYGTLNSTTKIALNKWYHVVITHDGANDYLYVNGVQEATQANTEVLNDASFNVRIGAYAAALSSYTSGVLDDVRIYNRALSYSEVKALYNSGGAKVSSTPKSTASDGLSNGLVGHWTFDGTEMSPNVRDRSGQGNHGNLIGQTSTTTTEGKLGQALSFDGSNDYINCGSNASVLPDTFSFSAWVKTNNTASASALIGLGNNSFPYFALHFSSNRPLLYLAASNYRYWKANNPTNLVDNNWHHYVVVLPGNSIGDISNAVLYVDGRVQVVDFTVNSEVQAGKSLCKLGGYHTAGTFYPLNGSMDDARLYNRVLSASEVLQLYNLGGSKVASTPSAGKTSLGGLNSGLVGHWTFDGPDMGPNVRDKSGQGNHGNLIGQTSTTTTEGKIGQALMFDGVNDYVRTGVIQTPSFTGTISMWVSRSSAANVNYLFDARGSSNGGTGYGYILANYTQPVAVSSGTIYINGTLQDSPRRINDSSWYHVVISGITLDINQDFKIGSRLGGSETPWAGKIDDVRIYNRTLSASEVSQLYNMGR